MVKSEWSDWDERSVANEIRPKWFEQAAKSVSEEVASWPDWKRRAAGLDVPEPQAGFTPAELRLVKDFLVGAQCDAVALGVIEMRLPNTDESWDVVRKAEELALGGYERQTRPSGDTIRTTDYILLGYLASKV
jgi:hypothetical protein